MIILYLEYRILSFEQPNRSLNVSANLRAIEILAAILLASVAELCYRIIETNYIVKVHFLPSNLGSLATRSLN